MLGDPPLGFCASTSGECLFVQVASTKAKRRITQNFVNSLRLALYNKDC